MSNVNGREDGGNNSPSGVGVAQDSTADQDGERFNYHAHGGEFMGQSPQPSPWASHSTVMFKPQILGVPLQRLEEMNIVGPSWMHINSMYEEDMHDENAIPTMITWTHGGMEVYVMGSWDGWRKRKRMRRTGKEFVIMRRIPEGVYQYRFIVDGQWTYSPDLPWERDGAGNAYNILDLKDYVPDATESIAHFEPPQSPESSYNNLYPGPDEYEKEPPMVPPHLEYTLLNTPSPHMEIPPPLSKPQYVVLNHLYMQKNTSSPSVVALGSTNRFHSKYVTVVLYKSTQG
ncbi:5'-AMP-activated protein kinase beta-2 subunit protein [Abeliophyllum distichum]|uniref:5'-AMP-activated protein kinase beta-2 subunit protein n=1 Tax=Abeliophyllum distichum TaxID=126358 RepID=A0ABD1PT09_9LAMI